MRYLIFSDSHGFEGNMREAIRRNLDASRGFSLDGILFLGDGFVGARRVAEEYGLEFHGVAGNCDILIGERPVYEKFVEIGGIKIMLMHGHRLADYEARREARKNGASVIFCGHSHRREDFSYEDDGRWRIFNPGSISQPRDGGWPSFGSLEVRGGVLLLSHGEIMM